MDIGDTWSQLPWGSRFHGRHEPREQDTKSRKKAPDAEFPGSDFSWFEKSVMLT